jgi:hypothetical protein
MNAILSRSLREAQQVNASQVVRHNLTQVLCATAFYSKYTLFGSSSGPRANSEDSVAVRPFVALCLALSFFLCSTLPSGHSPRTIPLCPMKKYQRFTSRAYHSVVVHRGAVYARCTFSHCSLISRPSVRSQETITPIQAFSNSFLSQRSYPLAKMETRRPIETLSLLPFL